MNCTIAICIQHVKSCNDRRNTSSAIRLGLFAEPDSACHGTKCCFFGFWVIFRGSSIHHQYFVENACGRQTSHCQKFWKLSTSFVDALLCCVSFPFEQAKHVSRCQTARSMLSFHCIQLEYGFSCPGAPRPLSGSTISPQGAQVRLPGGTFPIA